MRFKPLPVRHDKKYRLYSHNQLTNAYNAVIAEGASIYSASRRHGVPEQTLRDRVKGFIDVDCISSGRTPVLSLEEEEKLVNHLVEMAKIGYGYTRQELTDLASDYAIQLNKRSANNRLTLHWFKGFRRRWSDIKIVQARSLEFARAKCASIGTVENYFKELNEILIKYKLKDSPHLIFNIDESGFMTSNKPPFVVTSSDCDFKPQAVTSPRSQTVTVIGAGSASGAAIPPYFVFPGARMVPDLLKDATPGVSGSVSETGWSNMDIFRSYLKTHFCKFIPVRQPGQHALILLDGHTSHVAVDIVQWARENNIILFIIPAHTSHILQPLDVSCYGPLSVYYNHLCHSFTRDASRFVTRYDICSLVCKAYCKSMSAENLFSGFRRCGIYPFNKDVIPLASLAPSTVFNDNISDKVDEVASENDNTSNQVSDGTNSPDPDVFLSAKLKKVIDIKKGTGKPEKQRKCISKITSGRAITEDETFNKIKEYKKQSKLTVTQKNKRKPGKPNQNLNINSQPEPGPSTSKICVNDSMSESDSEMDESEKCCVCHMFTPVQIKQSNVLQFTNWAQCEACHHWVHLRFCCPVRAVRRGDTFLCPHCEN